MSVFVLDANIVSFYLKDNRQVVANITNNVKHFHSISGLNVVDWTLE